MVKAMELSFGVVTRIVLLGFFLTSCATTRNDSGRQPLPAPIEDRVVINGEVLPLPDEPVIETQTISGQESTSPVVKKLLATSEHYRGIGEVDNAVSSLERALRIEPRNAMLWSRLADIRYSHKEYQQAIQLAAKSNTLTGGNSQLRRQNWYLMANAHEATGNVEAAQKFRDKLR